MVFVATVAELTPTVIAPALDIRIAKTIVHFCAGMNKTDGNI